MIRPAASRATLVAATLALAACGDSTGSDAPPLGDPAYVITYAAATGRTGGFGPLTYVFVASADGRWRRRLLREDVPGWEPRWSPDGRRLTFSGGSVMSGGSTSLNSVYVVNADGTGLARVPSDMHLGSPVWSPDGQRLLVHYTKTAFDFGYATIRPDGSAFTPIPGRSTTLAPSWSPDGTTLLFQSWTGQTDGLFTKDVDDGESRVLADSATSGRWSPDGSEIAFTGMRGGVSSGSGFVSDGIWIMKADGTGRRRVTTVGQAPAWSPDGRSIVFITWQPGSDEAGLAVVSTTGGMPVGITRELAGRGPGAPDWRPSP